MFNYRQTVAALALTKAIPEQDVVNKTGSKNVEDMVSSGFVVIKNGEVVPEISMDTFTAIGSLYGDDVKAFNKTFFETFHRSINMSDNERLIHQAMHYLSTYGAERVGIKMPAYIPVRIEDVEYPERNGEFKLIVIEMIPEKELIERIVDAFCNIQTVTPKFTGYFNDLGTLITPYIEKRIDDVKSFQVKCFLVDKIRVLPNNPQEVLRYAIYTATLHQTSMLIKDRETITRIRDAMQYHRNLAAQLIDIFEAVPVNKMAQVFFRYKPLFLAFKPAGKRMRTRINQIRRAADKYHIPQDEVCLQNVFNLSDWETIVKLLDTASNRELVKIINKGIQKKFGGLVEVYNIRNGKAFVREYDEKKTNAKMLTARDIVSYSLQKLVESLHATVNGKTFYIPEMFNYAAPASERQFVGAIPYGSYIVCPNKAFTAGVHWEDLSGDDSPYASQERIDIDLHMNDNEDNHYGWNGFWGNRGNQSVIYSGDMTSAPKPDGATEAFYFNPSAEENKELKFILSMNLFNSIPSLDLMPKFFMTAKEHNQKDFAKNAPYNPNDLLFSPITIPVETRGTTIGVFLNDRFYFYGGSLTSSSVPSANYSNYVDGVVSKCQYRLSLAELLKGAGAVVLTTESAVKEYAAAKAEADEENDLISLAPEELKFDTLLNIIDGVEINK